jgi:hypothetical protein
MIVKIITLDDMMSGEATPEKLKNYDCLVIRKLPKNAKTGLIFNDFSAANINETECGEKYVICRRAS